MSLELYFGNQKISSGGYGGLKEDGDGKLFAADDGTYKKIINDSDPQSESTAYSAKKTEHRLKEVQNTLVSGQENLVNMWQKTTLNAVTGTPIFYTTDDENSIDKILVQCYKFVPGEQNIVQVLKDFNNGDGENFYHTDNVEFNGVARIKDSYTLNNIMNNDGLYESSVISKDEFLLLNRIEAMT